MRKKVMFVAGLLAIGIVGFSQAVKDRQVIPVAVNLNQVLRMTITNGGNIEFVFNSIDDYRDGLSGDAATSGANPVTAEGFYQTDFTVASSSRWKLSYGSEQATFIGTDNPGNTLALNNVGFEIANILTGHTWEGAGNAKGTTAGTSLFSVPTNNANEVAGLEVYPADLIEDNDDPIANSGDATENSFTLIWRCGTVEIGATVGETMAATSILNQDPSPNPDRYVTNVLFELAVDNL